LKQGAQKSACGMAADIGERGGKGKRDKFVQRRGDFNRLGAKTRAAERWSPALRSNYTQ
jgi:hypothetical protein